MEIADIKQQLPLLDVMAHYGLRPDQHQRLLCPFHANKTPSLQLYPKTATFCCFISNCNEYTGNVIRFIELMEKCSTHVAILKAQTLIGVTPPAAVASSTTLPADVLAQEAVLAKVFSYFKKALPGSCKAVLTCKVVALITGSTNAAITACGLHVESRNHHLVASMVKYGLLKPKAAGGYSVWAKDCILFPLLNAEGKTVSLYGRSIVNDQDQRHFYMTGRTGLYPGYPATATTKLLLTESIIDAASLLQQSAMVTTPSAGTILAHQCGQTGCVDVSASISSGNTPSARPDEFFVFQLKREICYL